MHDPTTLRAKVNSFLFFGVCFFFCNCILLFISSLFFMYSIFKQSYKYTGLPRCTATGAKSLQSCPTLCNPIDGSPPGSPVPGIFQARTLEWAAISFSNVWKWKVKVKSLSHVQLLATPWTTAYQAPPSMGFSRQEYWSGVPLPCVLVVKKLPANVGYIRNRDSTSGSERSPRGGHGNALLPGESHGQRSLESYSP